MGRPINEKYFGNTNSPYTGGDTGVGGEAVASYGTIVEGSGWTAVPTVTVSAPTPPGITATVEAHYKAKSTGVLLGAAGTGYDWHDVLTVTTGTGTKPQFQVSGIKVVSDTVQAAGSGYAIGDTFTVSSGMASNATLTITNLKAVSATVATSGSGAASADYVPGDTLTLTGGTGTASVFSVSSVKVRTAAVQAAGTTVWTTGDTVTFSAAGWATPAVLTITDDGGGGIASVAITDAGSWTTNGSVPTDPISPDSATVANVGGYQNDATFNISFGVNAVTVTTAGNYTVIPANAVSTTTNSATGTGATLNVSWGVQTASVTAAGSRTSAKLANPVTPDGTSGAGVGATFNLLWGVQALTATPVVAGDMTVFSSAPSATSVSPAGGTGATLTVNYSLLSVSVLNGGSGYSDAADAAISFSGATGAGATAVLGTGTQNAILVTAYIPTANGGTSALGGDIMKQESSRRYLVKTTEGIGQCRLVAAAPGAGEMTMLATDSAGGTYYVTKLTAHKATIVKGDRTGTQFTTGTDGVTVGWDFDTATADVSVIIANA